MYRLADGLSGADIQGMSLDPQAQDPSGSQNPREVVTEPGTDEQDPATPGGPAPFNGAKPVGAPVATDPLWRNPAEPKKPPYTPLPYTGPGPGVDTTTLHNARRAPMEEAMTDLWVEASRDVEAELERERMVRAKTAASNLWPFLSSARSEREFGHKLALCEPQLENLFPDDEFREKVTASLHQDYLVVTGAAKVEDLWQEFNKTAVAEPNPITALAQGYDWLQFEAAAEPEEEPNGGGTSGAQTNPAYDNHEPERGPLTGPSETFAQGGAGPDPWNPMNEQYPMQPTQWVVQPGTEWVDRPMNFGKQGTAVGHPGHPGHYQGEGVETGPPGSGNAAYFSGGPEGVAGTQQTGFPLDQTLPEPDERVDMFGAVPPLPPQPAPAAGPYSNTAPRQASRYLAEKDNHGACAHPGCNSPVYREGDIWKHLGGNPGHGVRLHEDHPWVVNQQANRVMAVRHTAPGGGEHAPYEIREVDGGYAVFNAKGERKNEEPKSKEEARQFQKALYANVPGASESAKAARKVARWVLAEASSSDLGTGGGDAGDTGSDLNAPGAPASMEPGGAGAVAGPPLTIPNQGAQTNPFADGNPASQPQMPMMANRTALVRERPTAENPSGVPDEYDERTWNAAAEQRPLQDAEQRLVNTPQRPGQAIPTHSSEPGEAPEDDDEDEERR